MMNDYVEPITVMYGRCWDYETEKAIVRGTLTDFYKYAMIYEGLEIWSIVALFGKDGLKMSFGFIRYSVMVFGV